MLKQFTLSLCLMSSLAGGAMAEDGASISVSGNVIAGTCTITPDSQSKQVKLGNISSRQFQKAGDGSAVQTFILTLEKCSQAVSGVTVTFEGEEDPQNPGLLAIENGTGSASGIAVAIYDQSRKLVPLNTASTRYVLQPDQTVPLKFYASYLSTRDSVTSGTATATATFVLNYD